jgi:BMFP domain-containing protein YqiC
MRMPRSPLEELGSRVEEAIRGSPIEDLQKNLRALLVSFFERFDVVPREDFEVQRKLLARAQEKLAALEARVAELEANREPDGKPPG